MGSFQPLFIQILFLSSFLSSCYAYVHMLEVSHISLRLFILMYLIFLFLNLGIFSYPIFKFGDFSFWLLLLNPHSEFFISVIMLFNSRSITWFFLKIISISYWYCIFSETLIIFSLCFLIWFSLVFLTIYSR